MQCSKLTSQNKCKFCGRELPVVAHTIGGKTFNVLSECDCEQAKQAKAQRTLAMHAEAKEQAVHDALVGAGVPQRFLEAEIAEDDFRKLQISMKTSWVKKGLYLFGTVGSGKTHRACAILKAYARQYAYQLVQYTYRAPSLCFISSDKMFDSLRREMTSYTAKTAIERLKTCDLLCIDDLGKEKPSEWTIEKLFLIVNARYESLLPTIFTTQYSIAKLGERLFEAGNIETAKAIVSRIAGESEFVNLGATDRRLTC